MTTYSKSSRRGGNGQPGRRGSRPSRKRLSLATAPAAGRGAPMARRPARHVARVGRGAARTPSRPARIRFARWCRRRKRIWPRAIPVARSWHYERARLLAPRAPAVAPASPRRAPPRTFRPAKGAGHARRRTALARRMGLDRHGWGSVWRAAGLVAFSWRLIRRRGLLALASAGAASPAWGLLAAMKVAPPPNAAVVVVIRRCRAHRAVRGADSAFAAPEGATVSVERTHGDYMLVAGTEGRGWVPTVSRRDDSVRRRHRS